MRGFGAAYSAVVQFHFGGDYGKNRQLRQLRKNRQKWLDGKTAGRYSKKRTGQRSAQR